MIWHIFKKDWKILWWKVLIVEALLICVALIDAHQGHFTMASPDFNTTLFSILLFAAGLFLVMDLAQLDSPDGAGQDWVARPVRRLDLLLSKLLFLAIAITPMVLVETVQNLSNGFSLGRSLDGAFLDGLSAFASTGLPILAFASLFGSLTETVAAAFLVILAKMTLSLLSQGGFKFPLTGPATGSALSWVIDMSQSLVYVAGALLILAIQYFRRKTIRARWVAAVVLLITSLAPLLPWQYAFALERRLSPMPGAGASANLFFNPSAGRTSDSSRSVCIPLAVSGVANGFWLNIDGVRASVLDGGKVVWSGRIAGATDASTSIANQMRGDLIKTTGSGTCQPIAVPQDELKKFENQPVRVQLDYSLTLFSPDKSYSMPAWNGDERMPGLGWCQTRVKDGLELGCISDNGQACLKAWTANAPASTAYYCKPDYDAMHGVSTDPWGGILSLSAHKNDTLVLQTYQPLDHFERQLTTPEIKLHDWLTAGQ